MQVSFSSSVQRRAKKRATLAPSKRRNKPLAHNLFSVVAGLGVMTALLGGATPAAHAQSVAWTQIYDYNGDNEGSPAKIARDNGGNIIVANTSAYNSTGSNYDWTVSKYNSSGAKLWTGTFDSPNTGAAVASGYDSVKAMTVDTSNNIYVTGTSPQAAASGTDWVTVKYDGATGARLWVKTYAGTYYDYPAAIARDSAQNIYVAGTRQFNMGATDYDIRVIKYSPAGAVVWESAFDGPNTGGGFSSGVDSALGMVVDGPGNVTVVGYSEQGATRKRDGVIVQFNPAGGQVWAKAYNGNNGDDYFNAIARDSAGNFYAAGRRFFSATNSDDDAVLVKYDTAGTQVWTNTIDGPNFAGVGTSRFDNATDVIVDGTNNIYMAGTVQVDASYNDAFLAKYNNAGTQLWKQRFDDHTYDESVSALTRDSNGNVYVGVTSQWNSSGTDYDWKVLKYSPAGTLISDPRYDRAGKYDSIGDIVIDNSVPTRDIYAVGIGEATSGTKPYDLIIQKWTQSAVDPTLRPFDMSVGQDDKARILWNRTNSPGVTLWTVNLAGTPDNGKAYNLPAGWSPVAQTVGTDNKMRFLLVQDATQKVAIWTFSANVLTLETGVLYGPVANYTPKELSISPDGRMRLLWEQNVTKRIAFWTIPVAGTGIESGVVLNPPAAGYTFRKVSMGSDGVARLLWSDGTGAYLMTLNAGNSAPASTTVYTLAGYSPVDISVGNENKPRILWSDGSGSVRIARYAVAGTVADGTPIALGPYTGLTPVSLWYGKGDNKARIMWRYEDGKMVLMRLNSAGTIEQNNTYGPY